MKSLAIINIDWLREEIEKSKSYPDYAEELGKIHAYKNVEAHSYDYEDTIVHMIEEWNKYLLSQYHTGRPVSVIFAEWWNMKKNGGNI